MLVTSALHALNGMTISLLDEDFFMLAFLEAAVLVGRKWPTSKWLIGRSIILTDHFVFFAGASLLPVACPTLPYYCVSIIYYYNQMSVLAQYLIALDRDLCRFSIHEQYVWIIPPSEIVNTQNMKHFYQNVFSPKTAKCRNAYSYYAYKIFLIAIMITHATFLNQFRSWS